VATKFLTLQESVRDAADLYLSLRYPPPIFICVDAPCGFVRHVDCRTKDVSKLLWGKYSGCFEEPTHGKVPTQVLTGNVPFLCDILYCHIIYNYATRVAAVCFVVRYFKKEAVMPQSAGLTHQSLGRHTFSKIHLQSI